MRHQTRGELKELHARVGTTSIYVTHDQEEAMTLGTRVVVMKDGRIVERGETSRVLRAPEADYTRALLAAIPSITPPGETPAEDRRDGRAPSSPA